VKSVIGLPVLTILVCFALVCGTQKAYGICESGKAPSYGDANAEVDALVNHAPKKWKSIGPQDFQYILLFDSQ